MSVEINAEAIPEELKERGQWLMWDASAETPRRPHWRSDFGASWKKPDDWHSFDEAHDAMQEKDSWGVGYVLAHGHENYPEGEYGGLDLDGCVAEDGSPKDWLPSLQPFFDAGAYIEYSPSSGGLHIPLAGFSPPEWWSDIKVPGADHEGVEAYGSKFFTFTGDALDGSGDSVADAGGYVIDWLKEAYTSIKDERPWETGNDTDDEQEVSAPADSTGNAKQIARAVDGLDARDVAEKTIVDRWNDDAGTSGDNRAFYPTWGGPDCNGTANIVDRDGWTDTGTDSGSGGPLEMAAIDMGELDHSGCSWGDAEGKLWWEAVDHLRDLNFPIPEYERGSQHEGSLTAHPDGGTAAAEGQSQSPTQFEWKLEPWAVLRMAEDDPTVSIEPPDEGDDHANLRDLRDSEKAYCTWRVMGETDVDEEVLAVTDGSLYAYEDGVWTDEGEQRLRELGGQALGGAYSNGVRSELEEQTRMNRPYSPDELGAPEGTVATPEGLLDLRERDTEPLTPDHLAVRQTGASYSDSAKCPEWESFLDESIRGEEDLLKFQEYAGYCLWHHAQPFGKALFLVGPTDSGKGTALKTIQAVLGEENVASETLFDLMQGRWGAAQLYGKMANIRNEVTPGGLKNVQQFKEMTGGGDRMSAEFKGKDKFRFSVTQKFLFATNQVPSIEYADEAFYNRLLFVRFPNTVPESEKDPNLLETLTAERAGILRWMLDGLERLLDNEQFTGERDIGGKKEICDAFGGVLDRFKHNCLELTGEDTDVIAKSDLYDLASAYADYIDQDPEWSQQQGFTRQMKEESGVGDSQTKQLTGEKERVFTGVQVHDAAIEELDVEIRQGSTDPNDSDSQQSSLV